MSLCIVFWMTVQSFHQIFKGLLEAPRRRRIASLKKYLFPKHGFKLYPPAIACSWRGTCVLVFLLPCRDPLRPRRWPKGQKGDCGWASPGTRGRAMLKELDSLGTVQRGLHCPVLNMVISFCAAQKLGNIFTLGDWILILPFTWGIKQHCNVNHSRKKQFLAQRVRGEERGLR